MPFNSKKTKKTTVQINGVPVSTTETINFIEGDGIDLTVVENIPTKSIDVTIESPITQYTDEMAQDTIGGILVDSSTIDFTYNDSTPSITASVIQTALDHTNFLNKGTNTHAQIDTHIADNTIHFTSEQIQDLIGGIITDSSTIDFTYNDAGNSITASVIQSALNHTSIQNIGTNTHAQIDTHIADSSIHLSIESVQDNLATSFFQEGTGIDFTYNDAGNTFTIAIDPTELDINGFPGTLDINSGGTGLTATPTDGQLLIGNTSTNSYNLSTLTAGANVTITNGSGSITIGVNPAAAAPGVWSWAADDGSNPVSAPTLGLNCDNSIAIGEDCSITGASTGSFVLGKTNTIDNSDYSSILGGTNNLIDIATGNGLYNSILGGSNNTVDGSSARGASIIGSQNSSAHSSSTGAVTIIGGDTNEADERNILLGCFDTTVTNTAASGCNLILAADTVSVDASSSNFIVGDNHTVTDANYNLINGHQHTVDTATNCIVSGQFHNLNLVSSSGVTNAIVFGVRAKGIHNNALIIGADDSGSSASFTCQTEIVPLRLTTTNNTATEMTPTGGSTSSATNRLNIPDSNAALTFTGKVVAINATTRNVCSYDISGTVKNSSGTASLVNSSVSVIQEEDAGLDVTLAVTSNVLQVKATGHASNTVYWSGHVQLSYVTT